MSKELFSERRSEWVERLTKEGRLKKAVEQYASLLDEYSLGEACIRLRHGFKDPVEIPEVATAEDEKPAKSEESSAADPDYEWSEDDVDQSKPFLIQMKEALQWAISHIGAPPTVRPPSPLARQYQRLGANPAGLDKLTRTLFDVDAKIEKSQGPGDTRLEEDHRKSMAIIAKYEPLAKASAAKQADDLIRMHPEILLDRMRRAGYEVSQMEEALV